MNKRDVSTELKKLGWIYIKDENNDKYFLKNHGNLQIILTPVLEKRGEIFYFNFDPSVSTVEFSQACSYIIREEKDFYYLICRHGLLAPSIEKGEPESEFEFINIDIFNSLLNEAVTWAKYQDIDKSLKYYAEAPTTWPGIAPLYHLAALVIQGNKERLEYYRQSFLNGDRLGFVPYITDEVIGRAVELVGIHSKRNPS